MISLSNERQYKIVYYLLNADQQLTMAEIAEKCNVSTRTIGNDLNEIMGVLKEEKITLIKKPGVGVWLDGEVEKLKKIRGELYSQYVDQDVALSTEERRWQVVEKLLLESKCTTADLGKELYVSKATIYADLDTIEKWLDKYNLTLIRRRKYGIEVTGKEQYMREAMVGFLLETVEKNVLDEFIILLKNNSDLYIRDYPDFEKFCESVNLKLIKELLDCIAKNLEIIFSRDAILYLSLYAAVSIKRIKAGYVVQKVENDLEIIQEKSLRELASGVSRMFCERFEISLSEEEIKLNMLQVMGSRVYKDFQLKKYLCEKDSVTNMLLPIVKKLIIPFEEELRFSADKELLFELILYLRNLLFNEQSGISKSSLALQSNNHFVLEELKEKNIRVFNLIRETREFVMEELDYWLTEIDINYIAILITATLEKQRAQNKKNGLIVTNKESPIGKLMLNRVQNGILDLEVVDVIDYYEVTRELLETVDIAISDQRIEEFPEIVVISPLVTLQDIELVKGKLALGG